MPARRPNGPGDPFYVFKLGFPSPRVSGGLETFRFSDVSHPTPYSDSHDGCRRGCYCFPLSPVNSTIFRLAFLGSLFAAWAGITFFIWKRRHLRTLTLLLPALLAIPFLLPGRPLDPEELRTNYMKHLTSYEATRSFWGGESPRGIDCSGLPRRAFRDAILDQGVSHGNGFAFRTWLEQWWFDASARALSEGYRGYTRPTGLSGKIRQMDYAPIEAGA